MSTSVLSSIETTAKKSEPSDLCVMLLNYVNSVLEFTPARLLLLKTIGDLAIGYLGKLMETAVCTLFAYSKVAVLIDVKQPIIIS